MGVPEVRATLEALLAGEEVTPERVAAFSDLDRDSAGEVQRAWPALGEPVRTKVMQEAVTIFLESIDADFVRLGLIAAKDGEAAVRLAAVGTLSESESKETADALLQLTGDPDDDVREAAVDSLGRFVLLAELDHFPATAAERITSALRNAAGADNSLDVRAAAVESLGWSSASWLEPILTEAYYAEERELRLAAVIGMGRSASDQWLEYLFDQIQSDDPEFRIEALNACAEIASEDSIEEVAAALDDEGPDVVFAAIAALGEIGGPDVIEILDDFARRAGEDFEDAIALAREAAQAGGRELSGDDDE